jgi:hypothetical protein
MAEMEDKLVEAEGVTPWQTAEVPVPPMDGGNASDESVLLYYRNPVDVVRKLFGREELRVVLRPQKLSDGASRIYNEAWTGQRWARYQVRG